MLCPVLGFPVQELLVKIHGRVVKMTKGLEDLSCGERLRDVGLFRLEEAEGESYEL